MLRAMLYYRATTSQVGTTQIAGSIRALGNPVIWWGALAAIPLTAVQAVKRRDPARWFVVLGYLSYLGIWIPISRPEFLYYYMPALYFGFLALAAQLGECWDGRARIWEETALLISLLPAVIFGLGGRLSVGVISGLVIGYVVLRRWNRRNAGIFVFAAFALATMAVFVYFFPLWVGLPLSAEGLQERMWLHGSGLVSWL